MTAVEAEVAEKSAKSEEQMAEQSSSSTPQPGMCSQCGLQPSKYKCPKCTARTCSLVCSKAHKAADSCDGQRAQWTPVVEAEDFNPETTSIEDQQFLHKGKALLGQGKIGDTQDSQTEVPPRPRLDKTKQFLLNNSRKRRVWLRFDELTDANQSRHEHLSDTIFWTVRLDFVRKENSDAPYSYTVHNIPETLTVTTLLNQFLKPKPIGSVVSAADLDAEKLAVFQTAGVQGIALFMPVPVAELPEKRFYKVDATKTLLDNLRNCVVADHPTIFVALDNEADEFQTITEEEAMKIRDIQRQNRANENPQSNRGRGSNRRGGRDDRRGGGRGGRGEKRQFDNRQSFGGDRGHSHGERPFKRGRGGEQRGGRGQFRGRGRPPFYQNNRGSWHGGPPPGMMVPPPPFSGGFDPRISRPSFVHNYNDMRAQAGWDNAVSPKKDTATSQDASMSVQQPISQPTTRKPKNYLNILGDDFSDSELPSD